MRAELPRECYLSIPAEITPELARSCPDKMKPLFGVQLLGRSVSDIDSAWSLLLDLARDIVSYDRALLLWSEDSEGPAEPQLSRGFVDSAALSAVENDPFVDTLAAAMRPTLVTENSCPLPSAARVLARANATSLISMPVYAGEQVLGNLILFRAAPAAFSLQDAHLLRVYTLAFEPILESLGQKGYARDYAFLDAGTGLFNRRYFEQHLEREIDRARRSNDCVSVLLVQMSQFEAWRTRHGHAAGEALLQEVAKRLRQGCRKSDTLARHRDDTFAVILPKTGKETLPIVARRVLTALGSQPAALVDTGSVEAASLEVNLSAVDYPEDAFSVEGMMAACYQGLEKARTATGMRYFQYPTAARSDGDDDIFDVGRLGLLREPLTEPSRLLDLFARLCLDTVKADRVSIMVREEDSLVVQVALGFEGQDELVRTTRVPLSGHTVSSWVAQQREPLLVTGQEDLRSVRLEGRAAYRNDSFMSFPLTEGDEFLGVIHFSNRSDGGPFSQADLESFRPISRVISRYLALGKGFARAQEDFLQNALYGLVDILESQIPGMENHSAQVTRLAEETARRLGHSEADLSRLRVSSRLHDLGNASFRSRVFAESRALSPRERALAQRHPLLGWKFLESMPMADIDREAILYHHEREDGSGYFGKRSQDIPRTAKILAVADVYQALVSPRPYRPAIPPAEALAYLEAHKGTLFDAKVLEAFKAAVTS